MTFRQLFEKYKNGTASPEEIALVEEELEKNEVINAYLASQLLEQPSLSLPPENTPQLHQVKSSVRRKFWMIFPFSPLQKRWGSGTIINCLDIQADLDPPG